MPPTLRLAMWSGPRNISTAIMRSWGNRSDTFVCDEPLYAHYLSSTGKDHPGAAEVISHGETDSRKVIAWLTEDSSRGKRIFFQKHMTHHLLPHLGLEWLGKLTNCFLIRQPRDVLLSYIKIVAQPELEDTGFPQQAACFDWVRAHQKTVPLVLDAQDVQNRPREILGALCDALGVEFQEAMVSWAPGLRPTDGIWAKHWYREVETSTSFRPYRSKEGVLPESVRKLYDRCLECYERLYAHRIR